MEKIVTPQQKNPRMLREKETEMVLDQLQKILSELSLAVRDAEKFDNGNASAGRRVRKSAMDAIKELKQLRASVISDLHERKGE